MGKSMKTSMITSNMKITAHKNIINEDIFNIKKLFEINDESEYITIQDIIYNVPLTNLFKNIKELNTPYQCQLFKRNKAWISEDSFNHQRYFTKNKNGHVFSFDLLDLLQFYYNKPIQYIYKILEDKLLIEINNKWKTDHEYKYYKNYDFINQIKNTNYPLTKKLFNKYGFLLKEINKIGEENVSNKDFCYKKNNIFFFSCNYLLNNIDSIKSKSTINKLINLFCFLGFIEKVPEYYLLNNLNIKKNNKLNLINFYIVNVYSKNSLEKSEKRLAYLKENNLKYYNLKNNDYVELSYIFNIANICTGTNKNPIRINSIQNKLESQFLKSLKENNFVSKELLCNHFNCSKKTIDVSWVKLVNKYKLINKRPNTTEKRKYKLKSNLNIAIKCS